MAAFIPGTIREANATGNIMAVNADGSINIVYAGTRSIAAGSAATLLEMTNNGIVRDPVSATPMAVNSDGSINVAAA